MKIVKTDLLEALNAVKPGVATNAIIEQMECVTFTGQDLLTYNDQIGVLYPFETDFDISINYYDLHKIISKIKENEFAISVNDSSELMITTNKGTTRAGLIPVQTEEIDESIDGLIGQLPNDENNLEWQDLPSDFIEGASLCISAASQDLSQGTLACLYTDGMDLVCSDNQRVSWYKLEEDLGCEFFIRANTMRELSHLNIVSFCISDSWVNFLTDNNVVFSTRLIKGTPMTYFLELFTDFKGAVVKLPEGLKDVVSSAAVMAEDDTIRDMQITLQKGEMLCRTQKARGWIEKKIPLKFNRKTPVTFQVSATFLQQILGLPLKMTVGKDKSLFESGSFKHVLLHRITT